ncbi:MAG TPA: ABC transporter substrate-binding protein, partial [Acidimicrobiales bacterium]|nr:ABC transporter substrate-binding protein [Acidimicrobiales bacterium]
MKNIRRGQKRAAVLIAAALLAAAPVAADAPHAAASASTPGLTAKTITIGQIADISGPIPGAFLGAVQGLDGWAAYVNSTGGIDGRKVVIAHKDSALACTPFTNAIDAIVGTTFASVG